MDKYFVNLCNIGWTELNDNDTIDNLTPGIWFSKVNDSTKKFVSVKHNNQMYRVHISQFQLFSGSVADFEPPVFL